MRSPIGVRRVIVVVLDGLRPDAIEEFGLTHLRLLADRGASTWSANTVEPSVTAAAMTSLLTGVTPEIHGLAADRFHIPRSRASLTPLPRVLSGSGLPTAAFLAEIPFLYRGFARRVAGQLGGVEAHFRGQTAAEILFAARAELSVRRAGLLLFHWPDADRAGHDKGWMSREYGDAARRLDATLGLLAAFGGVAEDPGTLLIALADHGGGGVIATDHDSPHPLDRTIPLILAGGGVTPGELAARSSILDVAPTVCWALGVAPPPTYAGRVLCEAFSPVEAAA